MHVVTQLDVRECQDCLCFAARRAARAVTQQYDNELRPTGLRATQFTLLVVLANAGAKPLSEVAVILGVERTTLTRNLGPLLARGYVADLAGEDRRIRLLSITKRGKDAVRRALPLWRKAQARVATRVGSRAGPILRALSEIV